MKNLHIENSYHIWNIHTMKQIIKEKCLETYSYDDAEFILNRPYVSMYIEWWLHNIGYYVTKQFCFNNAINKINMRCKDVDLEELF